MNSVERNEYLRAWRKKVKVKPVKKTPSRHGMYEEPHYPWMDEV